MSWKRYRRPVRDGLLIALGFVLGWLGPSFLPELLTDQRHQSTETQALKGLGYASGYERYEGPTGVLTHSPEASRGLNLYVSGHKPIAYLIDMQGEVIHRWQTSWEELFPERHYQGDLKDLPNTERWRRAFGCLGPEASVCGVTDPESRHHFGKAHVYPNGDLLVIIGYAMARLDSASRVLWKRTNHAHHDIEVDEAGRIYVPTLAADTYTPSGRGQGRTVLDDRIAVYEPDGTLRNHYSLLDAFQGTSYESLLSYADPDRRELFHTNSVHLLSSRAARTIFHGGDLLLSLRDLNSVVALDTDTRKITWAMSGRTSRQHDARLVDGGHLTIFDNGNFSRSSRIIEVDPKSRQVVWEYGRQNDPSFFSRCCGRAQRLPNGNTLVTDTDSGRVFEVTREGEIVWEFVNPHSTSEGNIASVFEMRRLPNSYFERFLEEP